MVCVVSLFGNSVDATSGKTALANIERSDHHLDFLDGIHRNRIGIRLTTVCTRRSQPENIIAHRTVDLETVITVIGAGKRDPSVLEVMAIGIFFTTSYILRSTVGVSCILPVEKFSDAPIFAFASAVTTTSPNCSELGYKVAFRTYVLPNSNLISVK